MRKFHLLTITVVFIMFLFAACSESGEKEEAKTEQPKYSPPETPYVLDHNPLLVIETSMGNMEMELFLKESPMTASNFLYLVREGYYDGLIWHRVIPGFVVQTGDPTGTGRGDPGYSIDFEINDKKHVVGAVAMARSQDPNSAGSQFYIALAELPQLDQMGYCVFGVLTADIEVAQNIAAVERDKRDKPIADVKLIRIYEKTVFTR